MPIIELHRGDCLEVMGMFGDERADAVISDLPYGCTRCAWDSIIPLGPLWGEFRRLLRPGGVVVLMASMRFAVQLISTAPRGWYRYDLVWKKPRATGFLDANRRPLRAHEHVLVFSPRPPRYRPIMAEGAPPYRRSRRRQFAGYDPKTARNDTINHGSRYPTSVLSIAEPPPAGHPTAKPVALMDWLVRTYAEPGQTVLDPAMGSGTTGVASVAAGREFIGIELDPEYFRIAGRRIRDADRAIAG